MAGVAGGWVVGRFYQKSEDGWAVLKSDAAGWPDASTSSMTNCSVVIEALCAMPKVSTSASPTLSHHLAAAENRTLHAPLHPPATQHKMAVKEGVRTNLGLRDTEREMRTHTEPKSTFVFAPPPCSVCVCE